MSAGRCGGPNPRVMYSVTLPPRHPLPSAPDWAAASAASLGRSPSPRARRCYIASPAPGRAAAPAAHVGGMGKKEPGSPQQSAGRWAVASWERARLFSLPRAAVRGPGAGPQSRVAAGRKTLWGAVGRACTISGTLGSRELQGDSVLEKLWSCSLDSEVLFQSSVCAWKGITEYPELGVTHEDHGVQFLVLHRTAPRNPLCA